MPAKAHRRWLERMARESDKLKLRTLREAVRNARNAKRTAKRRAREACKAAKEAVRTFARNERERLKRERIELRAETKRRRELACGVCVDGKTAAEATGTAGVQRARAALADEREAQAREKRWKRKPSLTAPKGAARAREVRQESDDAVRANLSPDELVVFEQVKARIKPTGRMTRTEAFAHWLHENPGEVALILERQTMRELRELERAERAAQRAMRRSYARVPTAELVTRLRGDLGAAGLPLDAVPF